MVTWVVQVAVPLGSVFVGSILNLDHVTPWSVFISNVDKSHSGCSLLSSLGFHCRDSNLAQFTPFIWMQLLAMLHLENKSPGSSCDLQPGMWRENVAYNIQVVKVKKKWGKYYWD